MQTETGPTTDEIVSLHMQQQHSDGMGKLLFRTICSDLRNTDTSGPRTATSEAPSAGWDYLQKAANSCYIKLAHTSISDAASLRGVSEWASLVDHLTWPDSNRRRITLLEQRANHQIGLSLAEAEELRELQRRLESRIDRLMNPRLTAIDTKIKELENRLAERRGHPPS